MLLYIPALMVMLLTLDLWFLPALNVVSEKEVGTIEQINVTPVPKFAPYSGKALALLAELFSGADGVFHISPVNLWHSTRRAFSVDLLFRGSFCFGDVRLRPFPTIRSNDAAINVCYVVLFVGGDFDERFVYPR